MPGLAAAQTLPAESAGAGDQDAQTTSVEQQAAGGVANVSSEPSDADIIVTGTLLRGGAPVGSNVISVGQDRVRSQGATSTNELLGTIPQVSNFFNNVPTASLVGSVQATQTARPNLRNLSSNTSSSASTLVLFDGHRISGAGVTQSTVDPDLIPTGAIERVEVVTDGGSSTYGADAVGGVINFITRRKFDGVQVDARYGFADDYWQTSANATVGKDWGSGSLYASYSFNKNDNIFGRDRDFIRAFDYSVSPAVPASRFCDPANITIGANIYAYPNGTLGGTRCDLRQRDVRTVAGAAWRDRQPFAAAEPGDLCRCESLLRSPGNLCSRVCDRNREHRIDQSLLRACTRGEQPPPGGPGI